MSKALAVLCQIEDEYSDWMTHNPLLQPSFDFLLAKYGRLFPSQIPWGERAMLLTIEQKHRKMVNNQLRWGFTPRTLDLILVKLCMDARSSGAALA